MCFLNAFLYCLHLYYGCIIIGVSGLLIAIVAFVVILLGMYPTAYIVWTYFAFLFVILYFLAKVFLLLGVGCAICFLVLVSFVFGLFSLIFATILCIWQIIIQGLIMNVVLGIFFIIVELYFAWAVLSYWEICNNCCREDK